MAETAAERIARILQLLPLAARDGGIGYDELAETLGITRARLESDLIEIVEREYYHDAETGTDIQVITLGPDRVEVWTKGLLRRPTRLGTGEAAALDLGLRILAAEREEPELLERMRALLEKVAWAVPDDVLDRFVADGDPGSADSLRALIVDAARRRQRVRFRYLKPGAAAAEDRSVEPYSVVYGEGHWYVVGHCPERDAVRTFRTDRILEATVGDATFETPADFDPGDYMADGRVYRADEEIEVTVRYGGRVAPYLLERGEGERQEDGGVVVRHRVANPSWIVAHVLGHGRDARVTEPAWVAALVREAAARVAAAAEEPPP